MEKGRRVEEKNVSKIKFIRNIIIVLIALGIIAFILMIAPDYAVPKQEGISLIINNRNVTSSERLKQDVIIENGVIYLSKGDLSNFFDKYLYYDNKYNQYITTSGTKEASIIIGENKMTVNGITTNIKGTIIQRGDVTYFPISDMNEVYDIEIKNISNTNTVTIDSLDRQQIQAQVSKKVSVKYKAKVLSATLEKLEEGAKVVVISEDENWAKIRTENGKIGYVKVKDLTNKQIVREDKKEIDPLNGQKVSLVWDYYSEYAKAPNRNGTTIEGVNVVSPTFFALEQLGQGNIVDKVGEEGIEYINWAKQNNYQIWPIISNESRIETTSEVLNDYKLRQKLINNIMELVEKYNLDGINMDFENMYKDDKDMYSRLIIELYPRLKEKGLKLSVDVTAPDGSETWSLCFDRNVIADNSDYIVFMAYDQHTASSTEAGTVAGYNWVKTNVDKFLGQEGVAKEKLILGIPFYTRVWTENANGELIGKSAKDMKDIYSIIPSNVEKKWDEDLKQYYVEYTDGANLKKIWIEDEASIKEKLMLARDYNLAGVAFWEKDRETEDVWSLVNEIIFNR